VERATRLELATFNLGIKIFAPLFSQLTKPLRKNQRACNAYVHAVPDLRIAAGRLRDVFYNTLLFATADLRLPFCARSKPIFEVRGCQINYVRRPLPCQRDPEPLFLQHLQICFGKMLVHALHAMHSAAGFARGCGTFAGQFITNREHLLHPRSWHAVYDLSASHLDSHLHS